MVKLNFNRTMQSAGVAMVGVMMTACAARSAPNPPIPPSQFERVVFEDTFDEYNPYWRQVRGQWAVADGRLLQARDDAREVNAIYFYDPLSVADADITTVATMLADVPRFQTVDDNDLFRTKRMIAGAGLVFRYQDENNFYLFRLAGEEGVVFGKVIDGVWHELANPRAADFAGTRLRTDISYRLRVRVMGNRIQCFINDKAVVNLQDDSLTVGRVGLTTFRSQAIFAGLRVSER